MRVFFFILLFNVLASFNFEVMDVCRSFPYFSKVEFHVVYFLDKLWILTGINKWTMRLTTDCIYEAVGLWQLQEPHSLHSIVLISMITRTEKVTYISCI